MSGAQSTPTAELKKVSVTHCAASIAYRAPMRRRERLAWLALPVWLFAMGAGLGHFMYKDQRRFETARLTLFDVQERTRSAEGWFRQQFAPSNAAATATVITVTRANCSCNRFTARHVERMRGLFAAKGVRFISSPPPQALPWIRTAPAALVFDAHGALVYFGPFSSSAWCGTSEGLVEPVLDRLLRGKSLRPQPMYVSGCFCDAGTEV